MVMLRPGKCKAVPWALDMPSFLVLQLLRLSPRGVSLGRAFDEAALSEITMVFTVYAEQHMAVPAELVWDVVDDFGAHHRFNPFIESCRITNGVPTGEGAEREIHLYDGSIMRQRIIDYEPMRSMVMEVIHADPVRHHHLVEISVTPDSPSSCVLAYKVSFKGPFGPFGFPVALLNKILLRSRYRHLLRGVESYIRRSSGPGD